MSLCVLIALCGFLLLFAVYLIAGIVPPQSVDYSGAQIPYDEYDYQTKFNDYTDIALTDGNVSIRSSGVYRLSGELTDGSVYIAIADDGIVYLLLDNASITCSEGPAVYVSGASNVIFTTAAGSENTISTSVSGGLESAIYSDADLTFNGSGTLHISSENGIAVNCNTNVRFVSGNYTIKAKENAVKASYSVSMQGGELNLESGSDGIKTATGGKTYGEWIGVVYIAGGILDIESDGDGINSNSVICVSGGEVSLVCGGGSTENTQGNALDGGPGMDFNQSTESGTSTKGLKADTGIYITGGTVTADCADDAIHSDGDVTIDGGTIRILSNGDGLQGDKTVNVLSGEVIVERCAEGICGGYITLAGGSLDITASDDGVNATNGNNPVAKLAQIMETELFSTGGKLIITGGTIHITATGDGLDSNGSIIQTGGDVFVTSISNGPDVALDYDGSYQMTGGELAALGNSNMMLQTISSEGSTACTVTVGATINNGSTVKVLDASGNELISLQSEYSCSSLILASEAFAEGATITVLVDNSEIGSVTLTGTSVQVGNVQGNMQNGQFPNGMQGDQMGGMGNGGTFGMGGPFSFLIPVLLIVVLIVGVIITVVVVRRQRKTRREVLLEHDIQE